MDRPKLVHPFTMMISGATGTGKSVFVAKMIEHVEDLIRPSPDRIILCYGAWQAGYADLNRPGRLQVEFREGFQNVQVDVARNTLLIVDDLMHEAQHEVVKWFTKFSHHRSCSIVYLVQNLFHQSKEHRTISLNSQYMVLFRNPRDQGQIGHLAKQILPQCPKALQQAFADATSKPFGYLLLDLKPDTPESLRLRTNVFPDEIMIVYVPKEKCSGI
jgi:hypothetical protein